MLTAFSRKKLSVTDRKSIKDAGGPLSAIGTTLAIFIVSQFVAIFIIELILSVASSGSGSKVFFDQSIPAQFGYVLIAEGLALGLVFWALKIKRLQPSFIGLGRRPKLLDLKKAIIGFLIFYGLLVITSALVSIFFPQVNSNQSQNLGFNNLSGVKDGVLAFVALVVLPPLGEEPLVRGYLYSALRARWRFVPAMIVTSLLFGVAHLEFGSGSALVWAAGIETFVLSIVLVYLRESTGALYAGALVHLANNLIAYIVHFHG